MTTASRPPETDIARVRRYCQRRVPPQARDQVRLETEVRGSAITIIERRAPWREDLKKFAPSDDMIGGVLAAWRDETNRLPPQRPRSG